MISSTDNDAVGGFLPVCRTFLFFVFFGVVSLVTGVTCCAAGGTVVDISSFDRQDLSRWQKKEFEGATEYSFSRDNERGWVLKAHSDGTASGLAREVEVDLSKTPWLNWSWKVEKLPVVENERTKKGDDYPARIYVIFKTGPWFWETRALNYVWSTVAPVGDSWPNAFTSNAMMKSVQSGSQKLGRWVAEKRNVREDIAALFDIRVETIVAIALMTDTDNSGSEAVAYYDEIFFSAE